MAKIGVYLWKLSQN